MRHQTINYVIDFVKTHEDQNIKKVLEVGSLDVNGSIRNTFEKYDYIGTDMRAGLGVDKVINGHNLTDEFKENEFDLVLCFDTFEHDDAWWITLEQMKKVLKPGGWIVLGFPSRRCPEHDHPHDYWRFMPQSAALMLGNFEDQDVWVDKDADHQDIEDEIYCYGRKP